MASRGIVKFHDGFMLVSMVLHDIVRFCIGFARFLNILWFLTGLKRIFEVPQWLCEIL